MLNHKKAYAIVAYIFRTPNLYATIVAYRIHLPNLYATIVAYRIRVPNLYASIVEYRIRASNLYTSVNTLCLPIYNVPFLGTETEANFGNWSSVEGVFFGIAQPADLFKSRLGRAVVFQFHNIAMNVGTSSVSPSRRRSLV